MLDTATMNSYAKRFDAIRGLEKQDLVAPQQAGSVAFSDLGRHAFFEFSGKIYKIEDINRYQETSDDFKSPKGYFIFEMTCLCIDTGETVYFEWEIDDELEISMAQERVSFRSLTDEAGEAIDEDDLDQIADGRDAVVFGGEKFWYEDDWASIYERGARSENVYMYEFENEGGTKFLTIEEWQSSGREEYRIYTSIPVAPGSIRVISKGDLQR